MKKLLFIFLCFVPFLANAGLYTDISGAAQMVGDFFDDVWTFAFEDVPSMFQRLTAWLIVWMVKAKLYFMFEAMQYSWGVAKVIIADLNIMSQITSQMSALPVDVRQALVEMRLFDAINLLFQAYMTKFVMNFLH